MINDDKYTDTLPEDDWTEYFCRVSKEKTIIVRKAEGGELVGHAGIIPAARGENLCVNPDNGHRWTMSDSSLDEFYKKKETQGDGATKDRSKT